MQSQWRILHVTSFGPFWHKPLTSHSQLYVSIKIVIKCHSKWLLQRDKLAQWCAQRFRRRRGKSKKLIRYHMTALPTAGQVIIYNLIFSKHQFPYVLFLLTKRCGEYTMRCYKKNELNDQQGDVVLIVCFLFVCSFVSLSCHGHLTNIVRTSWFCLIN